MPYALDTSRKLSFGPYAFPWAKVSIHAAQRVAMHEFPYLDGADLEKLNRRPYQITVSSIFDENIEEYPDNISRTLPALQKMFEDKTTEQLVLPRMGSLQAFLSDYKEEIDAGNSSSVMVTLEFIEENGLRLASLISPTQGFDTIVFDLVAVNKWRAELAAVGKDRVPLGDWEKLNAAVNSLVDLKNRGDLYASRAEQRLLSVNQLIRKIDGLLREPVGYKVVQSLRQLWSDCNAIVKQNALTSARIGYMTTKRRMTVGQISIAIYGTTERFVELCQLNEFVNDYAVPPETRVRHYVPTVKVAA